MLRQLRQFARYNPMWDKWEQENSGIINDNMIMIEKLAPSMALIHQLEPSSSIMENVMNVSKGEGYHLVEVMPLILGSCTELKFFGGKF